MLKKLRSHCSFPMLEGAAHRISATHFVMLPIVACLLPAPVLAQQSAIDTNSAQNASDIVVTARKREERLIDVPISVAAITGAQLEQDRIANVTDLFGKIPSLYFSSNLLSPGKDFINLVVRGVGAQSAGSPAVATIVDGVYVPALSFDIGFMDVSRVEVLRGPQGTLFGRNTEGGALNIVLRRPDAETRGRLALTYDEFNTARAQAAISGPLSDIIFGSASLDFEQSDGYLKNTAIASIYDPAHLGANRTINADDYKKISGRLALRVRPTDALDINIAVDGSRRKGLDGLPGVPRGTKDYIVRSEFQIDAKYGNYGAAATIDYDFGGAQLTSITGYRKVTSSLPFDFDGSPEYTDNYHDLSTSQSILSQELRLAGTGAGGNLKWLVGAYGFDEKHTSLRRYSLLDLPAFPNGGIYIYNQDQYLKRKGLAGFGDVTYTLFDRLDLNAGIRYACDLPPRSGPIGLLVD